MTLSADDTEDLRRATCDRRSAEIAFNQANEEAKYRKKKFEAATRQEQLLVDKLFGDTEPMPLFDTSEPPEPEDWRDIVLSDAGIDDALVEKLADANIASLGELEDHRKKCGETWAAELPGVGEAAKAKIEDALAEYWSEHQPEPESEPEDEPEPDEDQEEVDAAE